MLTSSRKLGSRASAAGLYQIAPPPRTSAVIAPPCMAASPATLNSGAGRPLVGAPRAPSAQRRNASAALPGGGPGSAAPPACPAPTAAEAAGGTGPPSAAAHATLLALSDWSEDEAESARVPVRIEPRFGAGSADVTVTVRF
jgi:hypothetical protein